MRKIQANTEVINVILNRQIGFLSHVMRKEKLELLTIQSEVAWTEQEAGRQRCKYMDMVKNKPDGCSIGEVFAEAINHKSLTETDHQSLQQVRHTKKKTIDSF